MTDIRKGSILNHCCQVISAVIWNHGHAPLLTPEGQRHLGLDLVLLNQVVVYSRMEVLVDLSLTLQKVWACQQMTWLLRTDLILSRWPD